jgi:hypothetical protein
VNRRRRLNRRGLRLHTWREKRTNETDRPKLLPEDIKKLEQAMREKKARG